MWAQEGLAQCVVALTPFECDAGRKRRARTVLPTVKGHVDLAAHSSCFHSRKHDAATMRHRAAPTPRQEFVSLSGIGPQPALDPATGQKNTFRRSLADFNRHLHGATLP